MTGIAQLAETAGKLQAWSCRSHRCVLVVFFANILGATKTQRRRPQGQQEEDLKANEEDLAFLRCLNEEEDLKANNSLALSSRRRNTARLLHLVHVATQFLYSTFISL